MHFRHSKFPFRLILFVTLATVLTLVAAPVAWAGPAPQTLPTAVPPRGSQPLELKGLRWSISTDKRNCATPGAQCKLTELEPADVPASPRGVEFASAASVDGMLKTFLPYTVKVCYQTTDKLDRIYYYDKALKRWVRLRVTVRTSSQVCTNVRFGNVEFAAGH